MKKGFKIIAAILLAALTAQSAALTAFAEGFKDDTAGLPDEAAVSSSAQTAPSEESVQEALPQAVEPEYNLPDEELPEEQPEKGNKELAEIGAADTELVSLQANNYPDITKINPSADGFTLTYTSYPGAYKYRVFIRKPDDSGWKKVGDTSALTYKHRYLTSGTEYRYTVRALDRSGQFMSSYNKKGYTVRFFSSPALTKVSSVFEGQKVTWTAQNGAVNYKVYVKNADSWKSIGFTSENSFVYKKAKSGKSYTYTVRVFSEDSKQAYSYYNKSGISGVFYSAPVMSGFEPVEGGTRLLWNAVNGVARYRAFVRKEDDSGWKKLGDTSATSFEHKGLADRQSCTYTVRAINANGDYISGFDPDGWQRTYFAEPALKSVTYKKGYYLIKWKTAADVAGYRLYKKVFGGEWSGIADVYAGFGSSYSDPEIERDVLYSYTLACIDEEGRDVSCYKSDTAYYVNGALADGDIKVNGAAMHFENGRVRQGYVTSGGRTYFYNSDGKLVKNGIAGTKELGYTVADKNGVCCVSEEIKSAATYMMKYCKGNTLDEKMKSGFMYMVKNFPYNRTYDHPKGPGDIAPLAIDMFKNERGNCFRYAACFTCVAKVAGYRARTVIGQTGVYPHGWVEVLVNGQWLICDPDANLPGYGRPDYACYMMRQHCWSVVAHKRCEVVIDENGVAVWK